MSFPILRYVACMAGMIAIAQSVVCGANERETLTSTHKASNTSLSLKGSRILESGLKERFDGTPPNSTYLVVGNNEQKEAFLVLANPNPWPEIIELYWPTLDTHSATLVSPADEVTVEEIRSPNLQPSVPLVWRIALAGKSVATWRVHSEQCNLVKWTHRASPQVLVELDSSLTLLSNSLSQLATLVAIPNEPPHGGFEISKDAPNTSSIPINWQASMIPATQWLASQKNARTGTTSLYYESQRPEAKGWLQSPLIEIPTEGRMSASVWILLEQGSRKPKLTASTGLVDNDGQKAEWTHYYSASDLERHDGIWQRIDFPIYSQHSLDETTMARSTSKDRIRFTLDIEGATALWVDDFWLNRVFLDEEERRRLRTELYLARRELSQNNPEAAWELVRSEVFRYVTEKASQLPSAPMDVAQSVLNPNSPRKPDSRRAFFDGMRRRVR